MYDKCIRNNPCCAGCELLPIDNRERNEGIPRGYNKALDSRPSCEDAWYVFCHEDFQPLEDLKNCLADCETNALWGPIGVVTERRFLVYCQWFLQGEVEGCSRRGENIIRIGRAVDKGRAVETYDCQCVIVHSSLLQNTGLRFDENLTFDLYAEDFCIAAKEKFGVVSRILPMKARHWSDSTAAARYYPQLDYLNRKWPDVSYTGTSSWCIGGGFGLRKVNAVIKTWIKGFLKKR